LSQLVLLVATLLDGELNLVR